MVKSFAWIWILKQTASFYNNLFTSIQYKIYVINIAGKTKTVLNDVKINGDIFFI